MNISLCSSFLTGLFCICGFGIIFSCHSKIDGFEEHVQNVKNFFYRSINFFPTINIAVVVCGPDDRVEETLVNIKSMLLFTNQPMKIHLFTEDHLMQKFMERFNSTQLSAMAPEHEQTNVAWYSRFARHPYYGKTGINSGVMLMNMSRIRSEKFKNDLQNEPMSWQEMLLPLYMKYRLNITWGDQDLLNIIFHHNPEMLFTFPCRWNYRPDHCMYMPVCKSAIDDGVKVLHGCRRAFHNDKWPSFKAVYSAIDSFDFNHNPSTLLNIVNENIAKIPETNCKKAIDLVLNGLQSTVKSKEEL